MIIHMFYCSFDWTSRNAKSGHKIVLAYSFKYSLIFIETVFSARTSLFFDRYRFSCSLHWLNDDALKQKLFLQLKILYRPIGFAKFLTLVLCKLFCAFLATILAAFRTFRQLSCKKLSSFTLIWQTFSFLLQLFISFPVCLISIFPSVDLFFLISCSYF